MSASLKLSKMHMFSSVWDVIGHIRNLSTDEINISEDTNIIRYFGDIENKIYEADSIIKANLSLHYTDSSYETNSYATVPVADKDNNSTSARLRSVYVNNTTSISPLTATWFVTVTDTSSTVTYSLKSSLEGSQGTGFMVDTDTTSTNGDITILSAAWENTTSLAVDDVFYFSVIDVYPVINYLSKTLAGSLLLKSIYTTEQPNESGMAQDMWNEAQSLLNKLKMPLSERGGRLPSFSYSNDSSSIWCDYDITDIGVDNSEYLLTYDKNYE